ncbi:hypothetical protein QJS10_CPA03g00505 [Acorus calamus]|uniref:Uncharacterized protein n=1 Tax=Acorus calamus TaxID=4465 RepID=A0AAV9F9F8_ACOCL|nr:hypothetical protein QJS10_CPA03g00505 [Acorus calamus]
MQRRFYVPRRKQLLMKKMYNNNKRDREDTVAVVETTVGRAVKRQARNVAQQQPEAAAFVERDVMDGCDELTWFLTVDEHFFLGWFPFVDDDFVAFRDQGEPVWDDDDLWQIKTIQHIPN